MAYFAVVFGISAPSWFIYQIGYLTMRPEYVCTFADGVPYDPDICTKENICDNDPRIVSWEPDPDSDTTLDNWN